MIARVPPFAVTVGCGLAGVLALSVAALALHCSPAPEPVPVPAEKPPAVVDLRQLIPSLSWPEADPVPDLAFNRRRQREVMREYQRGRR